MHQHHWQWSTSVSSFFPDFSHFLSIFTLITILRNVHRPCTLYVNILNKYTSCLPSFSWLFPDFFIIFALITILECVHRPSKQYPNINSTILIFFDFITIFQVKMQNFPYLAFFSPFWSLDSSVILVTRLHQQYLYISMIV